MLLKHTRINKFYNNHTYQTCTFDIYEMCIFDLFDYFIAVRFNNIGVSSLKMTITLKHVATY